MLLRQLSRESRIFTKDLVKTPVGMLCYVVDGLKAGRPISEIMKGLHKHTVFLAVHISTVEKVLENYWKIHTVTDVFNLC